MKTRLLGGVAALVVAIIGTVLLFMYVNGADRRAMANTETQEVYVVQKPIAAGTPVSSISSSIAKKPVPKIALAEGSLSDIGDIQGLVAAVSLEPGETLLPSRFVDPSSLAGPNRVTVPEGQQEVTLKLSLERVVGGILKAGDTVGVSLSYAKDERHPVDETQMTLHKVLVTNVESPQSSSQQGGEYYITLARTAADAERIIHAVEFGKVYLSREPEKAAENNGAPIERTEAFK